MVVQRSTYKISKMDCPAEEALIRTALEGMEGVAHLEFDLPRRLLTIHHSGPLGPLAVALKGLRLGSEWLATERSPLEASREETEERRLLWTVLFINFGFFLIEAAAGWISGSMGLMADGLDMLADALIYGLALMAVGGSLAAKKRVAKVGGLFQLFLALLGFAEVVRRVAGIEEVPDVRTMIIVSILALTANATCLVLLGRSKNQEAHWKASIIFTSNDVIINIGVIAAAGLVFWLRSNIPDLIIGAVVFVLVIRGALRIWRLGR